MTRSGALPSLAGSVVKSAAGSTVARRSSQIEDGVVRAARQPDPDVVLRRGEDIAGLPDERLVEADDLRRRGIWGDGPPARAGSRSRG